MRILRLRPSWCGNRLERGGGKLFPRRRALLVRLQASARHARYYLAQEFRASPFGYPWEKEKVWHKRKLSEARCTSSSPSSRRQPPCGATQRLTFPRGSQNATPYARYFNTFVKLQQIPVPSSGPSGSDLLSLPSHNPRVLEVHYTRSGASE